jgi:NAD(P)-dependent dehydrogenase (short-subunit alcohol dehydrogenase family)
MGEEGVRQIRGAGGDASFFQADFSEAQAVRDTVRFTVATYGRIDILMNNAISWNSAQATSVTELREQDWDYAINVGLKASYIACQEAIPIMIRHGGGSIIMSGSVRSFLAFSKGFAYDTIKAGLLNMARQLNIDYGKDGIRANTICPGQIVTDPEKLEKMKADPLLRPRIEILQPIGRVGLPNDVARAALPRIRGVQLHRGCCTRGGRGLDDSDAGQSSEFFRNLLRKWDGR